MFLGREEIDQMVKVIAGIPLSDEEWETKWSPKTMENGHGKADGG
jgi:hypothetical protein